LNDEGLEERIASCSTSPFVGPGFRHQPPGFDPLSGEGARRVGGRCNPPDSFPVLYLCLSTSCVRAELDRGAAQQGLAVEDLLPREVYRIELVLDRVLDLRSKEVRDHLGVDLDELLARDLSEPQRIGALAHELNVQALILPSATGVGQVIAVFVRNLGTGTTQPHLDHVWTRREDLPPLAS
jgi:RES domain-containing protein